MIFQKRKQTFSLHDREDVVKTIIIRLPLSLYDQNKVHRLMGMQRPFQQDASYHSVVVSNLDSLVW